MLSSPRNDRFTFHSSLHYTYILIKLQKCCIWSITIYCTYQVCWFRIGKLQVPPDYAAAAAAAAAAGTAEPEAERWCGDWGGCRTGGLFGKADHVIHLVGIKAQGVRPLGGW